MVPYVFMDDLLFPLHILSLVVAGVHVLLADHDGFSWLRGKVETLPVGRVRYYHRAVWVGLIGLIASGFLMFWPDRALLLLSPAFQLKAGFVGALVLNSLAIGILQRIALEKPARELTAYEAVPLIVSGAISTLSWLGAAGAAFFLYDF